jgi:hypothetical protein
MDRNAIFDLQPHIDRLSKSAQLMLEEDRKVSLWKTTWFHLRFAFFASGLATRVRDWKSGTTAVMCLKQHTYSVT